jgi:dihydroorotase
MSMALANEPQKRTSRSYIIENADLWTSDGIQHNQKIWVEDGKLKDIGAELALPEGGGADSLRIDARIDAQGKVIMPAGIDAQTHLRVPGQAHKELPRTGLLAALKGGYSAVLTMPNTQPTIDNVEVLRKGQDQVLPFEQEFGVHVFWTAAITHRLNSDEPTNFADLVRAGVRAFTNDGLGVNSDSVMEQAFAQLEKLGVPLLQHAEFLGHGGTLAPGSVQQRVGAAPYPDEPEWKMVERDLRELKKHPGARYHVLHVSSRKTLDLVRAAKSDGLNVTAEVSPHHLYFNSETIDPENTSFKMNPPIRSEEDQRALWQGLSEGVVDFVATDHAPHESLMKAGHFDKVAFGTIGLETTLPVLISGWKKGLLTTQRLVEVFASKPAAFLRLPSGFGEFVNGYAFHAVWVDVHASDHKFSERDFSSLSKNSCFLGSSLPGHILGAFHESGIFAF